jgi:DNA-binding PadR family transcriptional regulator
MTNAELAVLGLVVEQPRYGYQIEQVIEERGMRRWTEIGFSSIYFLLKKLERQGLIKGRWEKTRLKELKKLKGLLNHEGLIKKEWDKTERGPERWAKVYRPTDAGFEAFHSAIIEALSMPRPSPRPLMLGLANLPSLSTEEALIALGQYSEHLKEKMGMLRTVLESNTHPHPYFVNAMFELSLAVMQAEREWVEKFTRQIQEQSQEKQEQKI